jgi:prolyl oligopeptidase
MKRLSLLFTLAAALPALADSPKPSYPSARRGDTVDDYHGTKVADPYRWMEELDAPETRKWIDAEVQLTGAYLDHLPGRAHARARLTELWDYEKFGLPFKKGRRWFYSHNSGLQNQSVLYTAFSLDVEPRVLIDPNTLSSDGTVALAGVDVSENGKLLAYGLSASGSDWVEWHVRDVESGKDLPDVIKWTKFTSASFAHDGKGFYYSAYDPPKAGEELKAQNKFQKLYFHKLGTTQEKDELVYERKDQPEWGFSGSVSDDGHWLSISVWKGTANENLLLVKDLSKPGSPVVELIPTFDSKADLIGNLGTKLYLHVDKGAPRGKIVTIDMADPKHVWKELVPEGPSVLRATGFVDDRLFLSYLEDAHSKVVVVDKNGKKVRDLQLPGIGSAHGFGGERTDKETFYSFSSYAVPPTVYRYVPATGETKLWRQPKVKFDPAQYETKQVFFQSKDGTRVPLFLTQKKGLVPDGNTPVFLFGYGGFDVSETPEFAVTPLLWVESGGIYADVVLRGGGEYGESWHQAGMKEKKQNVFDDFIGAAEYLIKEKITSPKKLVIHGGSNGGLLVGAALTQRPELFAAAIPAVGVMDMLRFHKFTIGWAWAEEFGSSDDAGAFQWLYAYSPLHRIKAGVSYPPTLITTADHDDRVFPAHSFKFAATLQAAQAGAAPVLIRIDTKAGHGGGKPTSKRIEEAADRMSFAAKAVGMSL